MNTRQTYQAQSGLSMIEMMVTVALLTVIILGLVAMFNQTRKAFNSGLANVDWQDAGRVTMDMIARDIEQMAPVSPTTLFMNAAGAGPYESTNNFYVDYDPAFFGAFSLSSIYNFNAFWPLPAGDQLPVTMQRLYFTTRYNQQWNAVGYKIDPIGAAGGAGVLYRYSAVGPSGSGSSTGPLHLEFINNPINQAYLYYTNTTNSVLPFSRVIDGVVDFRIQAFDLNGNPISSLNTNNVIGLFPTNNVYTTNTYWYSFQGNAVPAYVEVELGILETPTLERFRSFSPLGQPPTASALNYLTNHAGQVHFFRQRIRVLGVDPTAYHYP